MKKIRILIADDHSIVRSGLRMLFKSTPDFTVVAEATNGEETVSGVERHRPDLAIIDISMPGLNGIEAIRRIRENHPAMKLLILSIHHDQEYVYQVLRAGANGYVLKDAGKKELFAAVRAVAAGTSFFSPGISKMMIREFVARARAERGVPVRSSASLTPRENEVLRYIAEGLTNHQIADKLRLSVRTVGTHRTNLMQKLDIHDVARLVKYAVENGIINIHTSA